MDKVYFTKEEFNKLWNKLEYLGKRIMKDMNEKNIKLEEEFKKLKVEMWKEAKKILETEYPRRDGQLDGECTVQMAKLQKKFNKKINELREKYK